MSAATEAFTINVELDELQTIGLFGEDEDPFQEEPVRCVRTDRSVCDGVYGGLCRCHYIHDPVDISFEYMLATPSLDFACTDQLGRDIFSDRSGPGQRCWWASRRRS